MMLASRATDHALNCEWHHDQYPWECTCGASGRSAGAQRPKVRWEMPPALALEVADELLASLKEAVELLDDCEIAHPARWDFVIARAEGDARG